MRHLSLGLGRRCEPIFSMLRWMEVTITGFTSSGSDNSLPPFIDIEIEIELKYLNRSPLAFSIEFPSNSYDILYPAFEHQASDSDRLHVLHSLPLQKLQTYRQNVFLWASLIPAICSWTPRVLPASRDFSVRRTFALASTADVLARTKDDSAKYVSTFSISCENTIFDDSILTLLQIRNSRWRFSKFKHSLQFVDPP